VTEQPEWISQALQDATVTVLCSPGDAAAVRSYVDGLPAGHLYRVRVSPFVPDGVAYAWQPDGILAPRALHAMWLAQS